MPNCNDTACKDALKVLHDVRVAERAAWRRLIAALSAAGFTGGATVTVIAVWLGKRLAEAGVSTAFPGVGWFFAGATLVLLLTAFTLWLLWRTAKGDLELQIDVVQDECDVECWPTYAR